jgi:hypothetical protein
MLYDSADDGTGSTSEALYGTQDGTLTYSSGATYTITSTCVASNSDDPPCELPAPAIVKHVQVRKIDSHKAIIIPIRRWKPRRREMSGIKIEGDRHVHSKNR